jgi:hypothetical protein
MSKLMLRRKGTIRAAVITAAGLLSAAVPMSASGATGMTINLQTVKGSAGAGGGTLFVAPTLGTDPAIPVTVYVYATVTGAGSTTASDFNGLEYLYYNINGLGSSTNPTALGGSVSAATLNSSFTANGSQGGVPTNTAPTGISSPGLVVGSNTAATSIAKPRSSGGVFANPGNGDVNQPDGNIYTNGAATSFLVETLTYAGGSAASTPTSVLQSNLSAAAPSAAAITGLVGANWFQDTQALPAVGQPPATGVQNGTYGTGSTVNLTTALGGDATLDGSVTIADFNVLSHNFNGPGGWAQGDFNGDGSVTIADFNVLSHNFNLGLGTGPLAIADAEPLIQFAEAHNDVAGFEAATGIALPEPTSLTLLAIGGIALMGRRKRVSG